MLAKERNDICQGCEAFTHEVECRTDLTNTKYYKVSYRQYPKTERAAIGQNFILANENSEVCLDWKTSSGNTIR